MKGINRLMIRLQLLAPPAHTCLLLTWELMSDQDLRTIRTEIHHFFAANRRTNNPAGYDDLAQRMGLVATELGGNALRHGLPPITVRLLGDDDFYILDVSDHAPSHAPELAAGSPLRTLAGGRGLHIVGSLTQQLCWYTTDITKHIWASFPVPRAQPRTR